MIRRFARSIVLAIARVIGTRMVDYATGRYLGKALIIPWRGKIHVIGLAEAVRPVFQPQQRLTYWKQEIVFTVHDSPNFENVRGNPPKDIQQ